MSLNLIQNVSATVITVTCIHPIDVIKTRLQISGDGARNYKSLGINGTIQTILHLWIFKMPFIFNI